jgi:hypothetical protein
MSLENSVLSSHGLDQLLMDRGLYRDPPGALFDASGTRVVCFTAQGLRGLHHVLQHERPNAWHDLCKATGITTGRALAAQLDRQLRALGKPNSSALPLDASLALLTRIFSAQGWGQLTMDLTHAAAHGLVMAKLDHSYFAELLPNTNEFVDALPAGVLQSFFEHISRQRLLCEEIACKSRGAPNCVFAIAAVERMTAVLPLISHRSADEIIAQLRK